MTFFTSYAQNGEDVLLWRVLGHIKNGFYIDVGANDTEEDSVTKAFYERGWWGINIEPLPCYHQLFLEQRPRDINLMEAAGSSAAEITFYDVDGVRGWATANPEIADQHRANGKTITETRVPVRPLADICAEHVQSTIHFLKIDVEGFEESVLRGMDFVRWRPWVVVVEATLPNSSETNHETWEDLILSQRYQFCYFDGLNRYYVAQEQAHLAEKLNVQPNVFDQYHSVHLVRVWQERDAARLKLDQANYDLEVYKEQAWKAGLRADNLEELTQFLRAQKAELHVQIEQMGLQQQAQAAQIEQQIHELKCLLQRESELETALLEQQILADEGAEYRRVGQQKFEQVQSKLASVEEELRAVQEWAGNLNRAYGESQQAYRKSEERVHAITASASWQITRPVRRLVTLRFYLLSRYRRLVADGDAPQKAGRWIKHQIGSVRRVLATQFPKLLRRITRTAADNQLLEQSIEQSTPEALSDLPPAMRQIPLQARNAYSHLQRARNPK